MRKRASSLSAPPAGVAAPPGAPPPWLESFQAGFGAMLRAPLDRSTGTLRAATAQYDPALRSSALAGPRASADERLAVYNLQYWFRMFGLFQGALPLSSRLLGHWYFNDCVTRFLLERPPRGFLIDQAVGGFPTFFARAVRHGESRRACRARELPVFALIEAIRIDAAWRNVFYAPSTASFQPSESDPQALLCARLLPSPTVELVREGWPLLELRKTQLSAAPGATLPLPPRLAAPQYWALARSSEGIVQLALERREAQLFALLRRHSVREALSRLEASCSPVERAALPERARRWLARSVEFGFWAGLA